MKFFIMLLFGILVILTSCASISTKDSPQSSESMFIDPAQGISQGLDASIIIEEYSMKIKPAFLTGLYRESWASPAAIDPDTLLGFYNYCTVYLQENPSGWDDTIELSVQKVLSGLSQYFDGITESQIKNSSYYDTDKNVCLFTFGFGGAVAPKTIKVEQTNENTHIYYDSMLGGEKNGEGIMTICESGDSFRFVSNEYTEIS